MKQIALIVMFTLLPCGCTGRSDSDIRLDAANRAIVATESHVSFDDLNKPSFVIGRLGLPLGEMCRIECEVLSGNASRLREFVDQFILRVTAINGDATSEPLDFTFRTYGGMDVGVAEHKTALDELRQLRQRMGLSTESLTDENYPGSTFNLIGYETGGFDGMQAMPVQPAVGGSQDLRFSTYLIILDSK